MRCTKSRKRRNDVNAAVVLYTPCKKFAFCGIVDQLHFVTKPTHYRSAYENTSLKGVFYRSALLSRGNGRKESLTALDCLFAGMSQQEAACSIGIFCLSDAMTALSEECRLLIARNTRNAEPCAHTLEISVYLAAALDLGEDASRNVEDLKHFFVPLARVDVAKHRSRCIRAVSDEDPSLGQLPGKPRVNRAYEQITMLGALSCTLDVIKYPFDLSAAEIGVYAKSRGLLYVFTVALLLKLAADVSGSSALPHYRAADWLARVLVPRYYGLSLIGYTYCGDLLGINSAFGNALG